MQDEEHKITEFDYENYLPPTLLKLTNTKEDDFKTLVRAFNLFTQTDYENLKDTKEAFKHLMPFLRSLDEEETKIFLHKL